MRSSDGRSDVEHYVVEHRGSAETIRGSAVVAPPLKIFHCEFIAVQRSPAFRKTMAESGEIRSGRERA